MIFILDPQYRQWSSWRNKWKKKWVQTVSFGWEGCEPQVVGKLGNIYIYIYIQLSDPHMYLFCSCISIRFDSTLFCLLTFYFVYFSQNTLQKPQKFQNQSGYVASYSFLGVFLFTAAINITNAEHIAAIKISELIFAVLALNIFAALALRLRCTSWILQVCKKSTILDKNQDTCGEVLHY